MAIKIGTILIDIQANTAALVDGMTKAQRDVEKAFSGMKNAVAGFAAFVGVGLSLRGLTEFVSQAIDTQVQIAKMSAATGVSAEKFSELAYIAKATGTPMEALSRGLQFLDKNMVSAASGSGAKFATLFDKLGISVKDSNGHVRDAAVVFSELQQKLGSMSNQTEAAGIRMMLLGRGSGELAYMMGLSKEQFTALTEEAHRFGFVLDDQSRNTLLAYHEHMNRLRLEGEGMATQFAVGLTPALINVANGFASAIGGASGFRQMGQSVGEAFGFIAKSAIWAVAAVEESVIAFKSMAQVQKEISNSSYLDRLTGKAFVNALSFSSPEQEALSNQLIARGKKLDDDLIKLANGFNFNALVNLPKTGGTPDLTKTKAEDVAKLANELDKLGEKTRKLLEREEGDKFSRLLGDINEQLQKISLFEAQHPERIWVSLNKQATDLKDSIASIQNKMFLGGIENLFADPGTKEEPFGKRIGDMAKLSDAVQKADLANVLKTPVGAANVTGFAQAMAELSKLALPEGTEDRNRRALAVFNEVSTAMERYSLKLKELDILQEKGNISAEDYDRALLKLNRELLPQALAEQNTIGGSLHAALLRAADDGRHVGEEMANAFKKAIDGLNQGLADLFVGDKANFGQVLKNLGKELFTAELHKIEAPLLLKLGLGGQRGDSPTNPMYVMPVGALGTAVTQTGGGGGGIGGLLGGIMGLFGFGGGGGAEAGGEILGLPAFLGGFASGGFLGAGEWGTVGEQGPELIFGGRSGATVLPHGKSGGDIYIDARGADASVEMRVMRAIANSKTQAVREAVMAVHERNMRRPD